MGNFVEAVGRWVVSTITEFFSQLVRLAAGLVVLYVLFTSGSALYNEFNYTRAEAVVTGRSVLCEASYPTGRYTRHKRVIPCAEVPSVKAKLPEINWDVRQVVIISVSYPVGDERQTATLDLSDLGRRDVAVGQTVAILYPPGNPKSVAASMPTSTLVLSGVWLVIGLAVLALPTLVHRWRRRRTLQQIETVGSGPFAAGG